MGGSELGVFYDHISLCRNVGPGRETLHQNESKSKKISRKESKKINQVEEAQQKETIANFTSFSVFTEGKGNVPGFDF